MLRKVLVRSGLMLGCVLLALPVGALLAERTRGDAGAARPSQPAVEPTSFRAVVKKVLPAVVSIETRVKVAHRDVSIQPFEDKQLPDEFHKFFDHFGQAPELQSPQVPDDAYRQAMGSGFIVDPNGTIVTNWHVVNGASEAVVHLQDGRKFTTKDIKGDPKTDLAIVKIDAKDLPHLQFADSKIAEIGDRVLAVGAPFGLTGSVTAGIISAKGRNLHMNVYDDFLQTDAAINPGNSGGPLVDLNGNVVGVNAAIKTDNGRFQGVGLAIASDMAQNVIGQLEKDGTVHRGYLGVQVKALDPEIASRLGVPKDQGVLVGKVMEGTPAAKGNVQAGDVITALDGKTVKSPADLQSAVANLPLNKPADLTIVRDGKSMTLKVAIKEQPQEFGLASQEQAPKKPEDTSKSTAIDKFGIQVTDLTPEQAKKFGLDEKAKGALITNVEKNSPAAQAGLQRGELLTKVDKTPVHSTEEAQNALKNAKLDKGVLFQVQSKNGVEYLMVKERETH